MGRPVDLELAYASATDVAGRIAGGGLTAVELMENALARIADVQPTLNCFTAVWADEARTAAQHADAMLAAGGTVGPLHGVPIAVKETTPVAGRPHTCGSVAFQNTIAPADSSIVQALRAAGAIIVGTTTSPEFAHAAITDSPLWGVTRNPWNPARTTGGSSGGSGAAVASGCVYLAEGSDMGGSVRIPAAWCGLVGLKPGIGRIPMDVLPGLFDTISHHGPLARTIDDARLFLAVTQGPDERDIMSVTAPLDLAGPTPSDVRGMRLALSIDLGCWYVDPQIAATVQHAADALADAGAVIEPVDPGFTPRDEWVWIELWGVFMAGYFGHLVEEWGERMDPDVVGLIELGNSLSAAHVKRLEIERTDFWHRVSGVLHNRDALLCPTMSVPPGAAAKADEQRVHHDDGLYHAVEMTSVFNLVAPCPALSVPCGFDADGMPIGLQVVGHRWRDDTVLRIGRAVELALPGVGTRRPTL